MKRIVLLLLSLSLATIALANRLWVSPDGALSVRLPTSLTTPTGIIYPAPQSMLLEAGWRQETDAEMAEREAAEEAARKAMPKTISKLDLLLVLREMDKLDAFFSWLDASGLKPFWDAAQELSTDHPLFGQALESVQEALGVTDEERDAILGRIAK